MPTVSNTELEPLAESVEQRFRRLAAVWKKDTAHLSSINASNNHPAYQEIIGMGWDVVPFLLHDIAARGRIDKIAAAWVQWGQAHGYSCV
jgi:hypothetical protein